MMNKRFMIWPGILLFLAIFMYGCTLGTSSETIIIADTEENQTNQPDSGPFQLKTIYRLPDSETVDLLGWSSSDSVIGLFRKEHTTERMMLNLGRLIPPYEKSELLGSIDGNSTILNLSPDGKTITKMVMTATGTSVRLISLSDGKEKEIANFSSHQNLFLQDATWSNNSRYLCFLVINPTEKGQGSVSVYDMDSETTNTYQMVDFDKRKTLTGVNISDDGQSVLLTMFETSQSGRSNSIVIGAINGGRIHLQYEHQIGRDENAWLNNYQFGFLGTDGTLYLYDRRTGELSVLLEKVDNFTFSQNRMYIAYSLYDKDTIYVGKLQDKNVLYKEAAFHGVTSSTLYWSPDDKRLLINGLKSYFPAQKTSVGTSPPNEQPIVITFQ